MRTNVPEIMADLHTIADLSDPDQIRRDIDACATRWQLDTPWIRRTMHRTVRFWRQAPTMRASRQWPPVLPENGWGAGFRGDAEKYPSTEDSSRSPRARSKRPSCSTGGSDTTCCTKDTRPSRATPTVRPPSVSPSVGLHMSLICPSARAPWASSDTSHPRRTRARAGQTDENAVVAPGATDIVRGDLFALGRHRLLCGDATDPADVHHLLEGQVPGLMVTDPPYGVAYDPAWRHRMDPRQRTAVGRVANDDRVDWRAAFALFGGDVAYVWHAGLFAGPVAAALQSSGFALRNQIIWVKQHFA